MAEEVFAMLESFADLHPVLQALSGTGFTWLLTVLGNCFYYQKGKPEDA